MLVKNKINEKQLIGDEKMQMQVARLCLLRRVAYVDAKTIQAVKEEGIAYEDMRLREKAQGG